MSKTKLRELKFRIRETSQLIIEQSNVDNNLCNKLFRTTHQSSP
jgi:hypothetical protein